jgi:hypothetical protein
MTGKVRRRVAVAAETEVVKACFGANSNLSAATAMTAYARLGATLIGEVVMTQDAVHRAMFVMRKVEDQSITTRQERLAKR